MSDLRKAAEMALEALETHVPYTYKDRDYEPIQALRQALAQPDEVLAEREACARVCDGWTNADGDTCAEAIRERGKP